MQTTVRRGCSRFVYGLIGICFLFWVIPGLLEAATDAPFVDDFESGLSPNWVVNAPWARTSEHAHGGTYSLTDSPNGLTYGNSVNISATLASAIDLSATQYPVLTFWQRYSFQTNSDLGYVEISTNGGNSWIPLAYFTGTQSDWVLKKIDLSPLVD